MPKIFIMYHFDRLEISSVHWVILSQFYFLLLLLIDQAESSRDAMVDTRTQVSAAYSRPVGIDTSRVAQAATVLVSNTQPIETRPTNGISAPSFSSR